MFRVTTIIAVLFLSLVSMSAQRWEEATLPAPYDEGFYLDIYFLPDNPLKGWACDKDSGYVVRTVDGGQTWTGSRAGPDTSSCHLEYIQFFSNGIGYTSGPCGLFKSLDDGATWTQIDLPDTVFQIWGAWFKTANEGWVTGGGCGFNAFLHTTDGGATFNVFIDTVQNRSNLSDPLWQNDMPAGEVLAIGNGTLWKSTDDGDTWAVESNTGTTHPWHEEITRSGNTIMVACATSNCAPFDYAGGGARFSLDGGQNWNAFEAGADMYGAFLVTNRIGWVAGINGNVWATENAGQDWELRNCGLDGKHMDDIFFISEDIGWVAGNGLFYLAPPRRRVEPDRLSFTEICTGQGIVDTVWVYNDHFYDSPWESRFTGEYDYLYRIMNPLPDPLPACDSVAILIEYRGQGSGTREAQLEIIIYDPDTILVVDLAGTSRDLTAAPDRDRVEFTVRVGSPDDRVIFWRSDTAPQESIEAVVRDSGDTNIVYAITPPQPIAIAPQVTQTIITANPQDTGWIETRFRVTTDPCARDTIITVRVYGESPIINAPDVVSVDVACDPSGRLQIPIDNTGNIPLIISEARLEGADPGAFTVVGMASGTPGPPWSIPAGGSDTLVVRYAPITGDEIANLVLVNDDYTTTRGIVTPWTVVLTGSSNGPSFSVAPDTIDLGTLCIGQVRDTAFRMTNDGDGTISARALPSGPHVTGLSTSFAPVNARTNRTFRFQWQATRSGAIVDTIRVEVAPCDTSALVVVLANVIDETIEIDPDPWIDSTFVGGSVQRQVALTARTTGTVTITAIDVTPTSADLTVALPPLPAVLSDGEQVVVTLTWTPTTEGPFVARLSVTAESACDLDLGTDILLHTYQTGDIDVSSSLLELGVECEPGVDIDSILVVSSAIGQLTLDAPFIVEPGTAFTVLEPTAPVTLDPGEQIPIIVQYDAAISASSTATLRVTVAGTGGSTDIDLVGRLREPIIIGDAALDYGVRGPCEDPVDRVVGISNQGDLAETMFVDGTTVPTGFSVDPMSFDLAPGELMDLTVTCTPSALPPGISSGTILLRGATCDDSVFIDVTVSTNNSRLIMAPDPVTAGQVILNDEITRTVTITNLGTRARRIVSLTIQQDEAAWRLINDPTGQTVNPGTPLTVDLAFQPTFAGIDNAQLVLVDEDLCELTSSIDLVGEGIYRLDVRIDEYYVDPHTTLTIPVWFDTDIRAARPEAIDVVVTMSPLMFEIEEITSTYPDAEITTQWSRETITIEARKAGPNFGISGPIIEVRGKALPAIPDSTVLDILSVTITGVEPVVWRDDDGLLKVNMCGPYNSILMVRPPTVNLGAPHPVRDVLHLEVDAPFTQTVEVDIVDPAGQVVATYAGTSLPEGASTLTLPVDQISGGVYIVRVRTDKGGAFSLPVVVVR